MHQQTWCSVINTAGDAHRDTVGKEHSIGMKWQEYPAARRRRRFEWAERANCDQVIVWSKPTQCCAYFTFIYKSTIIVHSRRQPNEKRQHANIKKIFLIFQLTPPHILLLLSDLIFWPPSSKHASKMTKDNVTNRLGSCRLNWQVGKSGRCGDRKDDVAKCRKFNKLKHNLIAFGDVKTTQKDWLQRSSIQEDS